MTDLATIEQYGDPVLFIENALERAKTWLSEALEHGDIGSIVELKSQAEAIRAYTTQKQLGKDAELSATEIVRRAERGLGLAIRKGQEEGTVNVRGVRKDWLEARHVKTILPSPSDFATPGELSGNESGIYAMTDNVSDDDFEQAIEDAKAEKNLSRANVVRKVNGNTRPGGCPDRKDADMTAAAAERPPAPSRFGTRRKHVEQIEAACHSLSGLLIAFENVTTLDGSVTHEEAARLMGDLSAQLRAFRHLKQLLKERIAP